MIPRLGRILPFAIAVLGIFDTMYIWTSHMIYSIFLGVITFSLAYFMFKDHASVSPKESIRNMVIPILLMVIIAGATWLIFF